MQVMFLESIVISSPAYYAWNNKYGGMDAADVKRFKELKGNKETIS